METRSPQSDTLQPALLQAQLDSKCCTCRMHHYPTIDSTNTEAERLLEGGAATPFVVLANQQTAGRGRMGRTWYSTDPGNLYLSFAFTPNLPPSSMAKFTLWQGLALCAALRDTCALPIQVKWPNDLIHNGKKVAGMLTQARIDKGYTRTLIFGLGLNVNSQTETWPEALQHTASSLASAINHPLDIHTVAAAVIQAAIEAYEAYVEGTHESTFNALWHAFDGLKGRVITVSAHDANYTGRARGIAPDGSLTLELEDGTQRIFQAGDVTLHKAYQNDKMIN